MGIVPNNINLYKASGNYFVSLAVCTNSFKHAHHIMKSFHQDKKSEINTKFYTETLKYFINGEINNIKGTARWIMGLSYRKWNTVCAITLEATMTFP